jgi:hypothetical protein
MGIPLAPPTAHAIDGVVYTFESPIRTHRFGWLVGGLVVAALFSGGTVVGLLAVALALLLAAFSVDRTVDLAVRLHRLEVRTTRLGLFARTVALPWHDLREAELEGQHIVVRRRDRTRIRIAAWGPVVQLAWVVGAINAQIRRATVPQLTQDVEYDLARLDQLVTASTTRVRR